MHFSPLQVLTASIVGIEKVDFMDSSIGLNIQAIARYPILTARYLILTARNARDEQNDQTECKLYSVLEGGDIGFQYCQCPHPVVLSWAGHWQY